MQYSHFIILLLKLWKAGATKFKWGVHSILLPCIAHMSPSQSTGSWKKNLQNLFQVILQDKDEVLTP